MGSSIMNYNDEKTETIGIHHNQDDTYVNYQGPVYCCTVEDWSISTLKHRKKGKIEAKCSFLGFTVLITINTLLPTHKKKKQIIIITAIPLR